MRWCAALVLGCWLLSGCSESEPDSADHTELPYNVLLISVDTLRADHMGCYGYGRNTTPNIDSLALESLVFDDIQATSSWTLPSLASMMTGLYPGSHGCVKMDTALASGIPTLSEKLTEDGYFTGAIVSQAFASARYGMSRGFLDFDGSISEINRGREFFKSTAQEISTKATRWLEARVPEKEERPWFLWLHYFDPHMAYISHEGVTEQFGVKREMDRYDGEIAFTDEEIGRVLDLLDKLELTEHTAILFTADHGEEFKDHGGLYHRDTLYREVLHVPLILRVPGSPAGRDSRIGSLIDVAPTILDLVGLDPLDSCHGVSLLGDASEAHSAVWADLIRENGQRLVASIGEEKWIQSEFELAGFTRSSDLLEKKPLEFDEEFERQKRTELKALGVEAARFSDLATGVNPVELTPEERKALEALGYTDG